MADYTVIHGKAASFYNVYERKGGVAAPDALIAPVCGHGHHP